MYVFCSINIICLLSLKMPLKETRSRYLSWFHELWLFIAKQIKFKIDSDPVNVDLFFFIPHLIHHVCIVSDKVGFLFLSSLRSVCIIITFLIFQRIIYICYTLPERVMKPEFRIAFNFHIVLFSSVAT